MAFCKCALAHVVSSGMISETEGIHICKIHIVCFSLHRLPPTPASGLNCQFKKIFLKHSCTCRENEVLKVQLKKYVGAVQMLKREGQTAEGEGETEAGRGGGQAFTPS